jgi:hypothetical protein
VAAPIIVFREFATSGQSPSGERITDTHGAFVKVLGVSGGQELDFGVNDITNSGINSSTKAIVGYISESGDMTNRVFNMRFWLSNTTALNEGTVRFNEEKHQVWQSGLIVQNSSSGTTPTALPSSGNLVTSSGFAAMSGVNTDDDVTEYIYLSIYTATDVPVGVKGGATQNTFRYRLTADYY